jgi:HK97 family phage portal protein
MPPPRIAALAREPQLSFPKPVSKDASGYGVGTAGFGLGSWGLTPGSTGIAATPLTALGIATAWICVSRIAQDNGKLPRKIMKRLPKGGATQDFKHPLNKLLREPNPWQSPSQFWGYVNSWYALRGNAFIVIVRGDAGEPRMLLPLSPDRCSVRLSPTGQVFYQVMHPSFKDGQSVMLHRDNVMHIRTAISFDGYTGISPIAAAPDVFGIGIATQQHGAVMFRQGARLSGVITHPGKLNPEGRAFLRQEWRTVHSGVQNAFETAVLDEGMKFDATSMNAEDSQLLQSRQFSVLEVARMFGVPPHKAGDFSRAHFANVEQSNLDYKGDTLVPLGNQQEEEMWRTCLYTDEQDDYYIAIDYDEMLRTDRKTRYETDEIGIRSGRLTQNEARISDGKDPNVPGGDEYQKPLNMGTSGGADAKPDANITDDEKPEPADAGGEGGGDT